jgi:hypothetical protein
MLRQADDRNWDRGVSLIARRRGTFPSAKGFQLVILVAILVTAANHLFALDVRTVQAIKLIKHTTDQVCETAPLVGTSTGLKLSREAQTKLGEAIGVLMRLGNTGAANYQRSDSVRVLYRDLEKAIQNSNNCKFGVFRTLSKALLSNRSEDSKVDQAPNVLGIVDTPIGDVIEPALTYSDREYRGAHPEKEIVHFDQKNKFVIRWPRNTGWESTVSVEKQPSFVIYKSKTNRAPVRRASLSTLIKKVGANRGDRNHDCEDR